VVAVLFILLQVKRHRLVQCAALAAMLVFLGVETFTPRFSWSPYYKITQTPTSANTIKIAVNGVPHQDTADVLHDPKQVNSFRPWPYQDAGPRNPLSDVLVVGAGNGNDVAVALAHGAKHVDAVEIDPKLYQIGFDSHPNHPYQDARVSVYITDGREYLQQTRTQYDLILFALPDSLTLVSGQASLRLESYLFTTEAMQTAKQHLRPGGSFSMYNTYRQTWLVDRLANTLQQVYGRTPCLRHYGLTSVVMTDSATAEVLTCQATWQSAPGAFIPVAATDDYPFLYLETPSLPSLYIWTLLLIAAGAVIFVRATGNRIRPMTKFTDLFFMGAAFLLLETKSVVQFALLFGTTWFVNALVFIGVLVAVLAAIEISRRWTFRRPRVLYALLLVSLAVAWLVPLDRLLALDFLPRFVCAVLLAFTPILIANLIFAQRFRDVAESVTAFGANLLGAMLGGILEYLSLLTGYRALLIVVAVLYGVSLLASPGLLRSVAAIQGQQ
ncbi:MAG: spermidine synthase, partial [Candidatus Dormibacteraeota bacterium]|nr:spermidine synthase [Candidatus Dormibacteraeota bacterium]